VLVCSKSLLARPEAGLGVGDALLAICFAFVVPLITRTLEHFLGLGRMACRKGVVNPVLEGPGLGEGVRKRLFLIATVLAS
jgi:hypothetical protein